MKVLYGLGWFLTRAIATVPFRIRITGVHHIPKKGGFILASNHVTYFDPLVVGCCAPRQLYFLAKEELFRNRFCGWVLRRVNALPVRRGTIDRRALDLTIEAIARGYGLTVFPEGTRSLTDRFLDPRPGVGMIAHKARCPIVPSYIHGINRPADCLLGRERLSVTFGEPLTADWVVSFPPEREGYYEIARTVMERIDKLKRQVLSLK